jgi:hypothetical protein
LASVEGSGKLSTLIEMRRYTDVRFGRKWLFLAIGSYVLWTTTAILYLLGWLQQFPSYNIPLSVFGTLHFSATTWLLLLSFTPSTGLSYLVYSLINRQNQHMTREEELFRETLERARSGTPQDRMSVLLPLSSAEQDFYRLVQKTHDRSAILWALLVLIPYAGWIFLIISMYLVSQELNFHEQTEQLLLQDIGRVLAGGTHRQALPSDVISGRANSLAYLFVSFVTLGVMSLFWLHRITVEQEAHFEQHAVFEPGLLLALPDSGSNQGSAL